MKLFSYFLVHPLDWEFCFMEVDDYKDWLEKSYQKKEEYNKYLAGELSEVLLQLDEMIAQAMKEWK